MQAQPAQTLRIKFKRRLFNKIFWLLKAAFENVAIRFIWVYGGSSASKTYSVVQLLITKMLENENETAMVLRKYGVDISDSIYSDFVSIIKKWGLQEHFIIQVNYIECKLTGAYIRFRGLDDSEKVKGISGFKRVILEEISQFDETDLKQIRKRLRGKRGQQIVCIFNPISIDHWIKKKIFDIAGVPENVPAGIGMSGAQMWIDRFGKLIDTSIAGLWVNEKGNMVILKTNYLDNLFIVGPHFIDQATIDDFEADRVNDPDYYEVYGLGNWGKVRTGHEFWKDFRHTTCTTDISFCEAQPVFLSCDENVNPYLPWQVWQLYSKTRMELIRPWLEKFHPWVLADKFHYLAVQIDEIFLEDPMNRVHHAAAEFKKRYPAHRVDTLNVGGDRTSIKEDTKKEKGENFFTDILAALAEYKPRLKIQGVNPSVAKSGKFINECYRRETSVAILINRKCEKSINDYQYAPELADGSGIDKQSTKDKKTGISYQRWGHASDCKRYIITTNFHEAYTDYLSGGRKMKPITGKNVSKNSY